jgi:hypothetical protein
MVILAEPDHIHNRDIAQFLAQLAAETFQLRLPRLHLAAGQNVGRRAAVPLAQQYAAAVQNQQADLVDAGHHCRTGNKPLSTGT